MLDNAFDGRRVPILLEECVERLDEVPRWRVDLRFVAGMYVPGGSPTPLLATTDELELHDALGAEVKLNTAVTLLPRIGQHDTDALLQVGKHLGIRNDLAKMRRGNFLLSLGHQHQVHRRFLASRLEGQQGAEKGVLRPLLIDGAAAHTNRTQTFLRDESAFQRGRAPL